MASSLHSPANGMQGAKSSTAASVLLRVVGAVLGGYMLSAALVALLAVGLSALGLARSEAVVAASLLGFVLYLLVLLWGFSERSLARLWAVLVGGTVLAYGLAYGLGVAIQRQMA